MNVSLIIIEENYGVIDSGYSACHSYYIIIFSSYPYTFQEDFNIYVKVVSSGEMVCEGTYIFQLISIIIIIFLQKTNPITQLYL